MGVHRMQRSTEVESDSEGSSDWIDIESATSPNNMALPASAYALAQMAFGGVYLHRGLSLMECLTPWLVVRRK